MKKFNHISQSAVIYRFSWSIFIAIATFEVSVSYVREPAHIILFFHKNRNIFCGIGPTATGHRVTQSCFSYFGFRSCGIRLIRLIHLIAHGYCN